MLLFHCCRHRCLFHCCRHCCLFHYCLIVTYFIIADIVAYFIVVDIVAYFIIVNCWLFHCCLTTVAYVMLVLLLTLSSERNAAEQPSLTACTAHCFAARSAITRGADACLPACPEHVLDVSRRWHGRAAQVRPLSTKCHNTPRPFNIATLCTITSYRGTCSKSEPFQASAASLGQQCSHVVAVEVTAFTTIPNLDFLRICLIRWIYFSRLYSFELKNYYCDENNEVNSCHFHSWTISYSLLGTTT